MVYVSRRHALYSAVVMSIIQKNMHVVNMHGIIMHETIFLAFAVIQIVIRGLRLLGRTVMIRGTGMKRGSMMVGYNAWMITLVKTLRAALMLRTGRMLRGWLVMVTISRRLPWVVVMLRGTKWVVAMVTRLIVGLVKLIVRVRQWSM